MGWAADCLGLYWEKFCLHHSCRIRVQYPDYIYEMNAEMEGNRWWKGFKRFHGVSWERQNQSQQLISPHYMDLHLCFSGIGSALTRFARFGFWPGSGFRPCFGQRPSQMSELSGPVSWWISFTKKIVCSLWFVLIQLWGKALFPPLDETLQISLTFEGTSCLDQAGYCLKYSPVVLQPTALDSDMKIWSTMIENASKCRFFLLCSGV